MTAILDAGLYDLILRAGRIFWAGTCPPLGHLTASDDIYDPARDFRLAPGMHRRFDLVMLVERDLAAIKAWPLVLDEALRLLAPGGTLLLRFSQTGLLTSFRLKHQLAAWSGGGIVPVSEVIHTGNVAQAAFRLEGPARAAPALDGYSFGVITDGRRPELVDRFIGSVQALEGLDRVEHEILVCAPEAECVRLDGQANLRTIVQSPGFEAQGWITRKKNQLVAAARHENLVIAHDRYTLPADFLAAMRGFGADFDVLVCAQQLPDGDRFPDWVTLGSPWSWTPCAMLEYGDYCPNQYVNGGIMLAKRDVLRALPWNELLFWQQAEDVELTRRMQQRGIVPRLARGVVAVTAHARADYIPSFELLPRVPDAYPFTGALAEQGAMLPERYRLDETVRLGSSGPVAWQSGVCLSSEWVQTPGAALWDHGARADVSLRLDRDPVGPMTLTLGLRRHPGDVVLEANGRPVPVEPAEHGLTATLPVDVLLPRRLLRLTLRATEQTRRPLQATSLRLTQGEHATVAQPGRRIGFASGEEGGATLRAGWSGTEDWGVWSLGRDSRLSLALGFSPEGDVRVTLELLAYLGVGQGRRSLGVSANDVPVGVVTFVSDPPGQQDVADARHELVVPHDVLAGAAELRLAFHLPDVRIPSHNGTTRDDRPLGIGLRGLTLQAA